MLIFEMTVPPSFIYPWLMPLQECLTKHLPSSLKIRLICQVVVTHQSSTIYMMKKPSNPFPSLPVSRSDTVSRRSFLQ